MHLAHKLSEFFEDRLNGRVSVCRIANHDPISNLDLVDSAGLDAVDEGVEISAVPGWSADSSEKAGIEIVGCFPGMRIEVQYAYIFLKLEFLGEANP